MSLRSRTVKAFAFAFATTLIACNALGAPPLPAPKVAPSLLPGGGGGDGTATPKSYFENGILIRSGETIEPLGADLMGDSINLYSGDVVFNHADVSLSGNNSLPVAVGRHKALGTNTTGADGGLFGDWDLQIPHLHTVATEREPNWYGASVSGNYSRCSQFAEPPMTSATISGGSLSGYTANSFWGSYNLYVPGSGDQVLVKRGPYYTAAPTDGVAYPIVTKDHWQLRCLPAVDNNPGEGFLARAPNGTTYQFDHLAVRSWPLARVGGLRNGVAVTRTINRKQVWMLPTLVTDRFGNWVKYTYASADGWRVASITSSDGRTITFTYIGVGNRVASVFDGTRTWSYGYNASGALQTVTLPDGSAWQINLSAVVAPYFAGDPSCDGDTVAPSESTGTITHPSGATGTFTTRQMWHGRSNVPGQQIWCGLSSNTVSRFTNSRSITSKTISGPGLPAMTWTFGYSAPDGSYQPCNGCINTKTVTIIDPAGIVTKNTYSTMFAVDEGLLLKSEEGSPAASAPLRVTTNTYATSGPFPTSFGTVFQSNSYMGTVHRPLLSRDITQQGVRFSYAANAFDAYARTVNVTRSNTLGYSRSEQTTFFDQSHLWVLGQVASKTVAGLASQVTTFDTATALPIASYKFGKFQESYTFNPDGTLRSTTDGRNFQTFYAGYQRGVPTNIVFPDGTSIAAVVNNIGAITRVYNEVNTFWDFEYDAMGRISKKTPPGGDPTAYYPTTFSFLQVPYDEAGIGAGHWRQIITTGNAVTINYFDARWRKRVTTTYDAANRAGTERVQRFDYDHENRTTFAGYPMRSIVPVGTPVAGTATAYDGLGRPTVTTSDSELGPLTTVTGYVDQFQKTFRDARGNITVTSYQAFDEPSQDAITRIAAPEGLNVTIARDLLGKPASVTRSGFFGSTPISATRTYVYDANQLLCKTIEPELGATVQAFDAANNLAWRAPGVALTNPLACDQASVPPSSVITYGYDPRNRNVSTSFGDGSASIVRTYTWDGLPRTTQSGAYLWTYGYNNRRLTSGEWLEFGATSLSINRYYDANGNLSQVIFPFGKSVSYSPNALGEATQVGGYATGIGYHPNGMVAGYALGNGVVHTTTQNVRGLPLQNIDVGVMQDQYSYDANGNISSITDLQEGVSSRTMTYDGLDRLWTAAAPSIWGSAVYAYDVLGNLRTSNVGARNSTLDYDGNNRLATVTSNGTTTNYGYDLRGNVAVRGTRTYGFDLGNRMVSANGVASYAYDGWGRRTYAGGADGIARTQVYSNVSGQLVFGITTSPSQGTSMTWYMYLAGKLIAEDNSVSGVTYSHDDVIGSPVVRTNGLRQIVSRTRYEPYGATAAGTNPGANGYTGIGFTGHMNDAATGLVYMQQRYYDPIAGRFLSVDPIVTDGNTGSRFNLYEYANSNPYRYTDPDGREAKCSISVGGCPTYVINPPDPAAGSPGGPMAGPMGQLTKSDLKILESAVSLLLTSTCDECAAGTLPVGGVGKAVAGATKVAKDVLVLGRREGLEKVAKEEGGRLSQTSSTSAKDVYKQNSGDIRKADRIIFNERNVPRSAEEATRLRGGEFSRAERELILSRPELLDKTTFINR